MSEHTSRYLVFATSHMMIGYFAGYWIRTILASNMKDRDMLNVVQIIAGSKTYIAGTGLILSGAGGLLLGISSPENAMAMEFNEAVKMIGSGLAIIGLGHKLEKAKPNYLEAQLSELKTFTPKEDES